MDVYIKYTCIKIHVRISTSNNEYIKRNFFDFNPT